MKNLMVGAMLATMVASASQAQNMFAFMGDQESGVGTIIIDPLTATGDGYVAVYDHHAGQIGRLLGVAAIDEGANGETRVQVGRPVRQDVIALLFVGDDFSDPSKAVDSVEIDIED